MTSNERHTKRNDESAESKARDAGQAKAEPRAQELTEKELGAVNGGWGAGGGGGAGRGGAGGSNRG